MLLQFVQGRRPASSGFFGVPHLRQNIASGIMTLPQLSHVDRVASASTGAAAASSSAFVSGAAAGSCVDEVPGRLPDRGDEVLPLLSLR